MPVLPFSPTPSTSVKTQFDFNRYDPKTYLIAYQVFIMNNQVELAYRLAKAAVGFNPQDLEWRKKYAQAALWSGHIQAALQQYLYFFNQGINKNYYADETSKLAIQIRNYDVQAEILRYKLKNQPKDKSLILNYVKTLQSQGFPKKARAFLDKQPHALKDKDFLEQYVDIASGLDEPVLMQQYLIKLEQVAPLEIKPYMQHVELLYNQGKLHESLALFQQIIEKKIPLNDSGFWMQYGAIAILAGDTKQSIFAYKQQVKNKSITQSDGINLVNLEYQYGRKEAAYQDAQYIYNRYSSQDMISVIFELGADLNHWDDLGVLLEKIPPKQLHAFQQKVYHAILIANLYSHLGMKERAILQWDKILERWKNNTEVQQAYTWFLIDNQFLNQLDMLLSAWCEVFKNKAELWKVHVVALTNLGDIDKALFFSLQHLKELSKNNLYLLDLADLLAQKDRSYDSYIIQQSVYSKLLESYHPKQSLEIDLALVQLVRIFAPIEVTYHAIVYLSKDLFKSEAIDNQILSYALGQDAYALAHLIIHEHDKTHVDTPGWMLLTLALAENDLPKMAMLLATQPKKLPYRDKVSAANRVGQIKWAQEYSYTGLKEHPNDTLMYDLFRETMLEGANYFSIDNSDYNFSPLNGYLNQLEARHYITPKVALLPYNRLWFPSSSNNNLLSNPPHTDRSTGLKTKWLQQHAWWSVLLGQRHALNGFMEMGVEYYNHFKARWEGEFMQTLHQRADETAPLAIAGIKNTSQLSLSYLWDSYNSLDTQVNYWQFNGQDYSSLGEGQGASLHWQHKLYLSHPDWNINSNLVWRHYRNSNQTLSSNVQRIVPLNTPPTPVYFMPVSYKEVNVSIGYGQKYRTDYSQDWRSMLNLGVSYADSFGIGRFLSAGFNGSVFGRDMLVLYIDYSDNTRQAGQNVYNLGMRYEIYG